jgi:hypothetical protein
VLEYKKNLSSFWLKLKQQWTIEEISIFSNNSHLEWRVGLSDTFLKWDYPRIYPSQICFNLVQRFRAQIFYCIYIARSSLTYIPGFSFWNIKRYLTYITIACRLSATNLSNSYSNDMLMVKLSRFPDMHWRDLITSTRR